MQIFNEQGQVIKPCNSGGQEIPVVHAVQAMMETQEEYKRAERFKKLLIVESVIITLAAIVAIRERLLGSRRVIEIIKSKLR